MDKKIKETTETGLKILQITAEHGYITAKEIEQITGTERSAFKYINTMNDVEGYLEYFMTGLKPMKAFYLTRKGADVLSRAGCFRVASLFKGSCDFGGSEFFHNRAIIQARLCIEKHPSFADIETPRVLLARVGDVAGLKPDAEIKYSDKIGGETREFRAALEVELHPKWHKRNILKMKVYDRKTRIGKDNNGYERFSDLSYIDNVIWVCNDQVTIDALCRAVKESRVMETSKHHFLTLSELLEKGPVDCSVMNYLGCECGLFS